MKPGIKPFGRSRSALSAALKHHRKSNICSACGSPMERFQHAKDYVVRCCPRCGRCYYLDSKHGRLIELAFGYGDFFSTPKQG